MGAYNIINAASMQAGQPEDITQVLANFQAIQAVLNGNIDSSNILDGSIVNADIAGGAAIAPSKLAGYPSDATRFLRGDGNWSQTATAASASVTAANTDLAAPPTAQDYFLEIWPNGGGSIRSIGAGTFPGQRFTISCQAATAVTLLNATAGGTGAQLQLVGGQSRVFAGGSNRDTVELRWDTSSWIETANARFYGFVAYTPAWTSTGTAPALGNGSLSGTYAQIGKMVVAAVALNCGSTTTYGTGAYSFSLPVAVSGQYQGFPVPIGTGVTFLSGAASINHLLWTATSAVLLNQLAYSQETPTSPITLANGSAVQLNAVYLAA